VLNTINKEQLLASANIPVYCPTCGVRIESAAAELSKGGDVVVGSCDACGSEFYAPCWGCGEAVHQVLLVDHPSYEEVHEVLCVCCYNRTVNELNKTREQTVSQQA